MTATDLLRLMIMAAKQFLGIAEKALLEAEEKERNKSEYKR